MGDRDYQELLDTCYDFVKSVKSNYEVKSLKDFRRPLVRKMAILVDNIAHYEGRERLFPD